MEPNTEPPEKSFSRERRDLSDLLISAEFESFKIPQATEGIRYETTGAPGETE
jgi:hypothetical protein